MGRRDLAIQTGNTTWRRHAGSNRGGVSFVVLDRLRRNVGTAGPWTRLLVQSIQ
jgi:hypothetical protein